MGAAADYPVSNCLVGLDTVLDFIPFVSTVSNAVVIVAKIALGILNCISPAAYQYIEGSPLTQRFVVEKSTCACIFLMIPFLNMLVAVVVNCSDNPTVKEWAAQEIRKKDSEEWVVNAKSLRKNLEKSYEQIQTLVRENNLTSANVKEKTNVLKIFNDYLGQYDAIYNKFITICEKNNEFQDENYSLWNNINIALIEILCVMHPDVNNPPEFNEPIRASESSLLSVWRKEAQTRAKIENEKQTTEESRKWGSKIIQLTGKIHSVRGDLVWEEMRRKLDSNSEQSEKMKDSDGNSKEKEVTVESVIADYVSLFTDRREGFCSGDKQMFVHLTSKMGNLLAHKYGDTSPEGLNEKVPAQKTLIEAWKEGVKKLKK